MSDPKQNPLATAAPPLDPRSAEDIRQRVETLLAHYAPLSTEAGSGAAAALVGVFARFSELVIERLNRAPDKNRLAFYDLIGASPQPPQPARVPLSFALAVGAKEATVPARTQVAAPAGPGRDKPVLFETERELALTPVKLTRLLSWDAPADRWTDHCGLLDPANVAEEALFRGQQGIEHRLYIAHDELLRYDNCNLQAVFDLSVTPASGFDARAIDWAFVLEDGVEAIYPRYPIDGHSAASGYNASDLTLALTTSGTVNFIDPASTERGQPVPRTVVSGISSRWLQCRLATPVNSSSEAVAGRVRSAQLPEVFSLALQGLGNSGRRNLETSFANAQPVDTNSDFYPLGPDPKLGAAWYIGSREVLSQQGQRIRLKYELSNPNTVPYPDSSLRPTVVWEFWNGRAWIVLGDSIRDINTNQSNVGSAKFSDSSNAFFAGAGEISFVYPEPPQPTSIRGVENYWIRARLSAGNFSVGSPVRPTPPSIAFATLSWDNSNLAGQSFASDALVRYDGLSYQTLPAGSFQPFKLAEDAGRSLYLGLSLPANLSKLPQRPISLFLDLVQTAYGTAPDDSQAAAPARLVWTYWNGEAWRRLLVRDETEALSQAGMIEFLPPNDLAARALFDQPACLWLRVEWAGGSYRYLPRLRRVLQNTTIGVQATTVAAEVLGSSSGEAEQRFTAARKPLLAGLQLEVREAELPGAVERAALLAEEGDDAITAAAGGYWLRWHAVPDFHGSGPRDRHYLVDYLAGEVRFGDGRNGLIPQRGAGNLRLRDYRSGGGVAGNAEAGSIAQLKTTVPSVAAVSQVLPAGGGVEAESLDALLDRAPRVIRHGDRAVTAQDFEDLARAASTEVARSLCLPLCDLRDTTPNLPPKPGVVSLIVVPTSTALKPTPSTELITNVRNYLDARRLPAVELVVLGAEYVQVDVQAEVGLKDLSAARTVEEAVRTALSRFLHPLTGGASGNGWDFGRRPHKSDLYALLETIDGVDFVRTLVITEVVEREGANLTNRFLVCSGSHRIDLCYGV